MDPKPLPKLRSKLISIVALLALTGAAAASAYVVVLKDGTQILTEKPPERKGQQVILTMPSGVETSYRADDVDFEKTAELNQGTGLTGRVLSEGVQEIERHEEKPEEDAASLSDIADGRSLGFPEARRRDTDADAASKLPMTAAGYVDLMRVEREPLSDAQVTQEILSHLQGQGHDNVRVYEGVAAGQPLLEIRANTESEVFKGIRDAASGLVQIAPRFPDRVQAFDLLLVSDTNIRGGQFSLSVEQAQMLVSGQMEPQVYFLRYVEF